MDKIIEFSKKILSIKSTADNNDGLIQVIDLCKAKLSNFTIEEFERNNKPSILVYKEKSRPEKFKIILNGHLDVVPAKEEQYQPYEKDGKIYARGSFDMKIASIVMLFIFQKLAKNLSYPIALQLVTDEEIGGIDCTKLQVENGVKADFVIAGENTNLNIKHKAKGVLWFKVSAVGKTAHGAYPWEGENAVWKIKTFLDNLQKEFPIPKNEVWQTTANLASINTTNQTPNRVPDDCTVSIDLRYIPEDREIIKEKIRALVPEGLEFTEIMFESDLYVDPENFYIKKLLDSAQSINPESKLTFAHGSSDLRHFSLTDSPGVEFGIVGEGQHSDLEWAEVESIEKYYKILKKFLQSF